MSLIVTTPDLGVVDSLRSAIATAFDSLGVSGPVGPKVVHYTSMMSPNAPQTLELSRLEELCHNVTMHFSIIANMESKAVSDLAWLKLQYLHGDAGVVSVKRESSCFELEIVSKRTKLIFRQIDNERDGPFYELILLGLWYMK